MKFWYWMHYLEEIDTVYPSDGSRISQGVRQSQRQGHLIFTGRNEVLAKVIFLHLSVIHSVHTGGGYPSMPCRSVPGGVSQHALQVSPRRGVSNSWGVSNFSGGLQFFWGSPIFWGGNQTPEYGQRSAGTHPTGMHSCWHFFLPKTTWTFLNNLTGSGTRTP